MEKLQKLNDVYARLLFGDGNAKQEAISWLEKELEKPNVFIIYSLAYNKLYYFSFPEDGTELYLQAIFDGEKPQKKSRKRKAQQTSSILIARGLCNSLETLSG